MVFQTDLSPRVSACRALISFSWLKLYVREEFVSVLFYYMLWTPL